MALMGPIRDVGCHACGTGGGGYQTAIRHDGLVRYEFRARVYHV